MTDEKKQQLSSLEMLLMGMVVLKETGIPLRRGTECPECGEGRLDYNGLLQLECPLCGFVSAEGAGCT